MVFMGTVGWFQVFISLSNKSILWPVSFVDCVHLLVEVFLISDNVSYPDSSCHQSWSQSRRYTRSESSPLCSRSARCYRYDRWPHTHPNLHNTQKAWACVHECMLCVCVCGDTFALGSGGRGLKSSGTLAVIRAVCVDTRSVHTRIPLALVIIWTHTC